MSRTAQHSKETSFNLRIDPALKAAFTAAAQAEDRPAAQILRDFMRAYVRRRERRAFEGEARRHSREAAALAENPESDEYAIMREIEADLADEEAWREG